MNRKTRKHIFDTVDIYPVTCEERSAGRSTLEVIEAVIAGGARIVQLREKGYSDKDLYALAVKAREVTTRADALLIINDRIDIALAVGADGVHLGQHDMPCPIARQLAPELLIGISTHSQQEALQAEEDWADYINIGPIFATRTKEHVQPLGVEAIRLIADEISIPFTVMGGISLENIDKVLDAGAGRVAVVSAITEASDIAQATRRFVERIRSG